SRTTLVEDARGHREIVHWAALRPTHACRGTATARKTAPAQDPARERWRRDADRQVSGSGPATSQNPHRHRRLAAAGQRRGYESRDARPRVALAWPRCALCHARGSVHLAAADLSGNPPRLLSASWSGEIDARVRA